ncbi:aminotransferase [Albimonas sp. CAU 1670]|uniref:aminotransferase n=1 Tax=Albimonas sp. CAU 1670 TaxID=3032599 RepID=UPI0023DB1676|nr:aminotransferase [Albimonas sp. CAU 1670]MDF2231098.1 aminotransferase [Albimonas sp. CAU 1670]
MNLPLTNMQTRDVEALLHPYTNATQHRQVGAHVIERGQGIYVYDEHGRQFIEGMAGLWCAGLGFGDKELADAVAEQVHKLPYYHLFAGRSHEPAIELAERIKELAPGMARVIFQSSGSEANDTQVKLAWYYNNALGRPEKKKIISRRKGYHGVTIASASMTGLPYNHIDWDLPLDRFLTTGTPHHWREAELGETEQEFSARLAHELEELIEREGPETVAAFIAEPVMGAGGVILPPEGYFEAIRPILTKYDVLMISDEVINGFGRTGEWFGADTYNVNPTSMSLAKQLTGGYAPLSAVALCREQAEVIEAHTGKIGTLGHGFTYGGHPVGCAAGVAALKIYKERRIVDHVRKVSPKFVGRLKSFADHPLVGEARGVGLIGALELSPDTSGKKMFERPGAVGARLMGELAGHGVILRAMGDSLGFCPPMIITEEEIDALFAPMEQALDATHAWAKSEGLV